MNKEGLIWLILLVIGVFYLSELASALPTGANNTRVGVPETKAATPPGVVAAQAGNVTQINITGESVTQNWQGYYGEVRGTITLDNANNFTLYNWSIANPQGEIYAANETITFTQVMCFNYSATGTYASDAIYYGATSKFGMNLTQLEGSMNLTRTASDGVNETFTLIGTGTHDFFYTGSLQFSEGECRSTRVLASGSGTGQSNKFEETLLYDPSNRMPVFTALIEQNIVGFDEVAHDFEMLVLEKGRNGHTQGTNYYFYVELE